MKMSSTCDIGDIPVGQESLRVIWGCTCRTGSITYDIGIKPIGNDPVLVI